MHLRKRQTFPLILFLALFFAAFPALATDPQPGDVCTVANSTTISGGAEIPGGHLLVCDGSNWQPVLGYSPAGNAVMFGSAGLAAAPLHVWGEAIIGNEGLACTGAAEGALRYTSASDLWEYCDGAAWGALGGGIAAALDDLTDVNVPTPSDGLPLIYSSASGQWVQAACDDVPNGLVFVDRTGMAQSVLVESNIILISGVTCSNVPVTVSGDGTPEYRVCATSNCSSVISNWTVANGTIQSGQYLQLRLTTNGSLDTVHTATVTVGSASDNWSVKTIGPQRVFITSGTYTGNLGGLSGADSSCQALADAAGLVGTFKAWLSDGTTSAASRLTHSTLDYVLVDGTVVANGWNDLTDGTLDAVINLTQTGAPNASKFVWTNTTQSGTIDGAAHCLNWTSNQGAETGNRGTSGFTTFEWTNNLGNFCTATNYLYCFEQDTGPPPGGGGGPGSGGGSAAGSDGEVQFNSGNYLATDPNFVFTSAGLLGVGAPNPQAPLEVAGEIKFSSTGLACSALTEGAQRYDTVTQAVEYCDGATWGAVGGGTPAGADREIQFNSGGAFGASNTFKLMADGDLLLTGTYTGTASVPATGAGVPGGQCQRHAMG
jgi:hypothetical protein